ncbi:MAG: SufD family Fe-S cluster assembly protein, partial [Bacteroidota bacterium]
DRSSTYSSYNLYLGGGIVRNNISALSKGSGTETNLFGTYVINGTQHVDNQTFIDHAVPHCVSNELYRGVLDDKSRGVFNGKVMVRQDAQKTNAFQQNNSIVLSPTAVMDTKPQLEIYADDVKCSHGATIGQLDEEAVFYLQTRGLQKDKARSLLQMAFLDEVLSEMKLEVLQNKAHNLISTKLNTVSPKK